MIIFFPSLSTERSSVCFETVQQWGSSRRVFIWGSGRHCPHKYWEILLLVIHHWHNLLCCWKNTFNKIQILYSTFSGWTPTFQSWFWTISHNINSLWWYGTVCDHGGILHEGSTGQGLQTSCMTHGTVTLRNSLMTMRSTENWFRTFQTGRGITFRSLRRKPMCRYVTI